MTDCVLVIGTGKHKIAEVVLSDSTVTDIARTTLYAGGLGTNKPWNAFPRSLNEKEFRNPHIVCHKVLRFAGRKKWKSLLQDILHSAMSNCPMAETGVETRWLYIFILLQKIMDATHIIHVRTYQKETVYLLQKESMSDHKVIGKSGKEIFTDISLHPGEVLADELAARNIKKQDFAHQLDIKPSHLSELLHGRRHVSAQFALKLEKLLKISAEYWMRLQVYYDLFEERNRQEHAA